MLHSYHIKFISILCSLGLFGAWNVFSVKGKLPCFVMQFISSQNTQTNISRSDLHQIAQIFYQCCHRFNYEWVFYLSRIFIFSEGQVHFWGKAPMSLKTSHLVHIRQSFTKSLSFFYITFIKIFWKFLSLNNISS